MYDEDNDWQLSCEEFLVFYTDCIEEDDAGEEEDDENTIYSEATKFFE